MSEEEKFLQSWGLKLQSWKFLHRIAQLHKMVKELLQAKQDFKKLDKNWTKNFLSRHSLLQSKYKRTIDQK